MHGLHRYGVLVRRFNGTLGGGAHPFVLHASGNHERLARAMLGEGYATDLPPPSGGGSSKARAVALSRKWTERFFAGAGGGDGGLDHAVLLIDSAAVAAGGAAHAGESSVCAVTTVGALMEGRA